METAKPPRDVSLNFAFISRPVSPIASIAESRLTLWLFGSSEIASKKALYAFTAPTALRSMQGICTYPPTGVACQPQMMFKGDFSGVCRIFGTKTAGMGQHGGGHGGSHPYFPLAPHFRSGDSGIVFRQNQWRRRLKIPRAQPCPRYAYHNA